MSENINNKNLDKNDSNFEICEKEERIIVEPKETKAYDASSPEYRSAFLKNLLDIDMTKEERAAFTHTTANTAGVLPAQMLNNIWDLVSGQHSILEDITVYRTGTILEVVKHTEIVQGKAKKVSEATANDDEKNTFIKVKSDYPLFPNTSLSSSTSQPPANATVSSWDL